jgi:hypothetical protein
VQQIWDLITVVIDVVEIVGYCSDQLFVVDPFELRLEIERRTKHE